MIEMTVQNQKYFCRTKDVLWYTETKTAIKKILSGELAVAEIKKASLERNIFNASSSTRGREIARVLTRRIKAVDKEYLSFFAGRNVEIQQQLCIVMVMLTDHSFLDFMENVYREKLIQQDLILRDSDIIRFFHELQEQDANAAKWTDATIKKAKNNYKLMLSEAGLLSETGTERKIIRPIIDKETESFMKTEGLTRIYKIISGERE